MFNEVRTRLFLIAVFFLSFQFCVYAQKETLPKNGVLLMNDTSSTIYFNLQKKTGTWRFSAGYALLPTADFIDIEVIRIAIYDGNKPRVYKDLTLNTRYKFFWNREIGFWDIKPISRQ